MTKPDYSSNFILSNLTEDEFQRLAPFYYETGLNLGERLYDDDAGMEYMYFPLDGIISLLILLEDGKTNEIAVVGYEGVVGPPMFMHGIPSTGQAVVQSEGHFIKIPQKQALEEFRRGGNFHTQLMNFFQILTIQIAQTAVCNRHHTVEQQLARWLLMSLDRLPDSRILMTQELIASMLGVRREGVTQAASRLQDEGLIKYKRGHINVLDRDGLINIACECYEVVRYEIDLLLQQN